MRNTAEKRLQNFITIFCALAFAIFSYTFVAIYKSPLIEMVYETVATGRLQYNEHILSVVLTTILVGLALWLNRYAKYQREWTAMAFLPSALILALLTDVERSAFAGGADYINWLWIFLAGVAVYAFLAFLFGRMLFEKIKNPTAVVNRIVWRNLILLMLLFLMVGSLSGGDKNFMREAAQYKYYRAGNYSKALAVGGHSPLASQQLTAQRAFLLSLQGELGDRLFEYPQYYGVNGLLPAVERDAPIPPDSVYSHIGLPRDSLESVSHYLARAITIKETTAAAQEFYLASLLLERRVVDFVDKLFEFYAVGDSENLPAHYKEALVLYSYIVPEYTLAFDAESLRASLNKMTEEVAGKCDVSMYSARLQSEYGGTYWWYFLYGE